MTKTPHYTNIPKHYVVTAVNAEGKTVYGAMDSMGADEVFDRERHIDTIEFALKAYRVCTEDGLKDVKVCRTALGDELTPDEIRAAQKDQLIADLDLTPDQVALLRS